MEARIPSGEAVLDIILPYPHEDSVKLAWFVAGPSGSVLSDADVLALPDDLRPAWITSEYHLSFRGPARRPTIEIRRARRRHAETMGVLEGGADVASVAMLLGSVTGHAVETDVVAAVMGAFDGGRSCLPLVLAPGPERSGLLRGLSAGTPARHLVSTSLDAGGEVRTAGIHEILADERFLVPASGVDGDEFVRVFEIDGRTIASGPERGARLDRNLPGRPVVSMHVLGGRSIVLDAHHAPLVVYDRSDVRRFAPAGANAFYRTGHVSIAGDRMFMDVVYCNVVLDPERRYRSVPEILAG